MVTPAVISPFFPKMTNAVETYDESRFSACGEG
jgi:hypothetical protein